MRATAKTHIVNLPGLLPPLVERDSSTEKVACFSTEKVARTEKVALFKPLRIPNVEVSRRESRVARVHFVGLDTYGTNFPKDWEEDLGDFDDDGSDYPLHQVRREDRLSWKQYTIAMLNMSTLQAGTC